MLQFQASTSIASANVCMWARDTISQIGGYKQNTESMHVRAVIVPSGSKDKLYGAESNTQQHLRYSSKYLE